MKSAFRFRLYPNREQKQRMLSMVEAGRQLWNEALGPQEAALGGEAALHLVPPAMLDTDDGEAGQSTVSRALLASRTRNTPQTRQSIRGIFRVSGAIPEIQGSSRR